MSKQPFAILRTEKIHNWTTLKKSVGHNLRTSKDERFHIKSMPGGIKLLAGSEDWLTEWQQTVNSMHLRKLGLGQNHTLAREFFLGMSPEWAEGKTKKEINDWAKANIEWLENRFGKDKLKMAVLHLDEQTPHIAAYIVPIKVDPKARGNGFTLSDRALGLSGNKSALVELQDQYAEAMKPFQLRRGIKHLTKVSHEKTSVWRAQMEAPIDEKIYMPKIEDPTFLQKFSPKEYAETAAKKAANEVYKKLKPYKVRAMKLSKDLDLANKKINKLEALIQELKPLADMFKAMMQVVLGHKINLDTAEGQEKAFKAAQKIFELANPKQEPDIAPKPEPLPEAPEINKGRGGRQTRPSRVLKPGPNLSQ